MLEVSALRVASGAMTRVQSLDLSLAARRLRCAVGPEWRRQDRKRGGDRRPGAEGRRARDVQWRGHHRSHGQHRRAPGLALVPQMARAVPEFFRGGDAARRQQRSARPSGASLRYGLRSFPPAWRNGGAARRLAVGRRAADAGDRAGARHQSEGDAARRAVGGLAVGIVRAFVDAVKRIRDTGVAILLVEQNLEIALRSPSRVSCSPRDAWYGAARPATPPTAKKSGKLILPISHVPEKAAPDLIRGGNRFSEKDMRQSMKGSIDWAAAFAMCRKSASGAC